MKKRNQKNPDINYSYTDLFFEKGHYLLKVKQIIYALIGWVLFIIPSAITIGTYLYLTSDGRIGWKIWMYPEGIKLINLLIIIFVFASFMTLTYTVTMTIVQNNRRESFVEKWPTFAAIDSIERQKRASHFMSERFGDEAFRFNVRYYDVTPDKNLANKELSQIINGRERTTDE